MRMRHVALVAVGLASLAFSAVAGASCLQVTSVDVYTWPAAVGGNSNALGEGVATYVCHQTTNRSALLQTFVTHGGFEHWGPGVNKSGFVFEEQIECTWSQNKSYCATTSIPNCNTAQTGGVTYFGRAAAALYNPTTTDNRTTGFYQTTCDAPPPTGPPGGGGGHEPDPGDGSCPTQNCTPLVLDLDGNGYNLSAAIDGVDFDLDGDGVAESISWTRRGELDAFLVRDVNGNGRVDDGTELFGGSTELVLTGEPAAHGFEALAQWDLPELGGNGDGVIDDRDEVYSELRLWIDINHDGHSQRHELFRLRALRIERIDLDYVDLPEIDQFGNRLKLQGRAVARVGNTQRDLKVVDIYFIHAGGLSTLP